MNLKLIAVLVVAILIAHAVLIHLLIRTSTLTEAVRHKGHPERPNVILSFVLTVILSTPLSS